MSKKTYDDTLSQITCLQRGGVGGGGGIRPPHGCWNRVAEKGWPASTSG